MSQQYDFLVIGSGIAGLSFALKAANHGRVKVITKSSLNSGSTYRAQGGIASVMHPADSIEKHIKDTLIAGAGLCRENCVKILVENGPKAIEDLINWGVQFSLSQDKEDSFDLIKEGGHSKSRILHSQDITGEEIQRALTKAVLKSDKIDIAEDYMAIDIIASKNITSPVEDNSCYGVYTLNKKTTKVEIILGKFMIICTGGIGQVYEHSTNDVVSTGDGMALAYRSGVPLENMEFVQFHPTSLYDPGHSPFLISEALRGFGGVLKNNQGETFMENLHPLKDLAPRDIVARAIDAEMKKTGENYVYLDMTSFTKEELQHKFPNIYQYCAKKDFYLEKDLLPVVPAAHFSCGGIKVDENSATSMKNLYVCGEAASTGVHGANRLASNSLLEGLVFSDRALQHMLQHLDKAEFLDNNKVLAWDESKVNVPLEKGVYSSALKTLQNTMSNYVGIVRSDIRLQRAKKVVDLLYNQIHEDYGKYILDNKLIEIRNMVLIANLIIESAIQRKESIGLHYNLDYPNKLKEKVYSKVKLKNKI